ncbi:MAG: hypothetical protein H7228_06895 [Polaromonas sp.]|nr:hypothetical protein [Polaromonas sp.]
MRFPLLTLLPTVLLSLGVFSQVARAEIPDEFQPLVVRPAFGFSERLVDLTPAFEMSKQVNKPILVYLGAADCPPCKDYTLFLMRNKDDMKAALGNVVLVDIRTWLKGPKLSFKIYDKAYTVAEFKARIGDSNKGLYYPSWWLITADGKQLRQLPQGSTNFTSVESHIRLIKGS